MGILITRLAPFAAAALLALPSAAQGQASRPVDFRAELTAGSDAEDYLRALQSAGLVPLYPWGLRSFSPGELDRLIPGDVPHPWAERFAYGDSMPRPAVRLLRPSAHTTYNSAFPYGANDGPVWAGRGLTAVVSAGAAFEAGPVSLRIEPVAYWVENRSFALMPRRDGSVHFSDPVHSAQIDLPQRFGDRSFARLAPGESTLRVDAGWVAAGISTASQVWGPAVDQPIILGSNAGGFPHLFLGSSRALPVGIGRVHGRIIWGSLAQSDHSEIQGHGSRRLVNGVVASFSPAWPAGLEVGVTRFFHEHWPSGGLEFSHLLRPFEPFLKEKAVKTDDDGSEIWDADNQLASAFFRWVLPRGGAEFYGEIARDDHSWDMRDFLLQPDHRSAYTLGLRKSWSSGRSLTAFRAEVVEAQPSHLTHVRRQEQFYAHAGTRQGHTLNGQLLGSPAVYGGGGSVVAVERYGPGGHWSVDWTRRRVRETVRPRDLADVNVVHSLGAETVVFRGALDVAGGVRGSWEMNRHFEDDAFNLSVFMGLRVGL